MRSACVALVATLVLGLFANQMAAQTAALPERLWPALEFLRASAAADDIPRWLAAHDAELTPGMLDSLHELVSAELEAGQAKTAIAAANLEASGRLRKGDRVGALTARVSAIDIQHMLANTLAEYDDVRQTARNAALKANSVGAPALAFRARTTAADAGYFAAQIQGLDRKPRQEMEAGLLDDLIEAARVDPGKRDAYFERYVSLTIAVISDATQNFAYGGDETTRVQKLKELAAKVEQEIPYNFEYKELPDETRHDSLWAQATLAALSYESGTVAIGGARLQYVLKEAQSRGEFDHWMSLAFQYYRSERGAGRSAASLDAERRQLLGMEMAVRDHYHSRAGRLWAAATADANYTDLLNDQLSADEPDLPEVFHEIELLKARLLLDEMSVVFRPLRDSARLEHAATLEHAIIGFPACLKHHNDFFLQEMLLASRQQIGGPWEDENQFDSVRQIESLYAEEDAGYHGVAPVSDLAAVQAALATDEAVIEYFIPYHPMHPTKELWIMIITRDRVALQHVPLHDLLDSRASFIGSMSIDACPAIDASPLLDQIVMIRNNLQRSDDAKAIPGLKSLHELLIDPVIQAGFSPEQYARWVVVAHGPLHYIPFAALIDGDGRFLVQRVAIALSPSASVWLHERNRRQSASHRVVGLMSPTLANVSLPPLLPVSDIASLIQRALPGSALELLDGVNATTAALRSRAERTQVLHFSTHGNFPERDAIDFHEVLLAPDAADDGHLRAQDIRSLALSNVALVILEICDGGLYNVGPSDEPYGLIPAFLDAGAADVVGTLWPLQDTFGREFIRRFYTHLERDGPAVSLRRTMESFIAEDEIIGRWAGFVAVGDGRPFW